MKPTDQTGLDYPGETGPFLVSGMETSFTAILNETCTRLEDSRNRGALKRIRKMEEALRDIEDDLDAILRGADAGETAAVVCGADSGAKSNPL